METVQCWALLPNASRCPEPAVPDRHFCERHGFGSGPHPCSIWRAPEAQMPPALVATIRAYWPAVTFPHPVPETELPSLEPPGSALDPAAPAPDSPSTTPPEASQTLTDHALRTKADETGLPDPVHPCELPPFLAEAPAPGPQVRRFPRRLERGHILELLGELFMDALNFPDQVDTRRLQALTSMARVLLQGAAAVKEEVLAVSISTPPSADETPLLRIYPPLPPEIEALLASAPLDSVPPVPPVHPSAPHPPALNSDEAGKAGSAVSPRDGGAMQPVREKSGTGVRSTAAVKEHVRIATTDGSGVPHAPEYPDSPRLSPPSPRQGTQNARRKEGGSARGGGEVRSARNRDEVPYQSRPILSAEEHFERFLSAFDSAFNGASASPEASGEVRPRPPPEESGG